MAEARFPARQFDRFFEYSLLGMVLSGYLAVAAGGAFDWPTLLLLGAAITLRALIVAGVVRLRVSELAITLVAVAYTGFYPIDLYYLSGEFPQATVHLVSFLASLLLIKARTRRDYFFLKVLALLEILAASIFAANISFLVFLGVFLLCGVAVLTGGEIRNHLQASGLVARGGMRGMHLRIAGLSVFVFAGVLVLSSAIFVVLPRTARAALQHLVPERFHLPGFANEVRLGQIGQIQQLNTPVMHVRIHDAAHPLHLKWRGSSLSHFDGTRWYNPSDRAERLPVESGMVRLVDYAQQSRSGRRLLYDVQLKNVNSDVLFFAGLPEFVRIDTPQLLRTAAGAYRTGTGWSRGLRYGAYSFLEDAGSGVPLPAPVRAQYLQLPPLDPRIGQLGSRLTGGAEPPDAKARAIEQHLRASYGYTLDLLEDPVPDPVAHFLFTRKKGHCEYFASAMTLMLRSAGVPSRVVTGFQSGVYNPVSGWYLIRASDAHSWVEAFIDGRGWLTYDPTPPNPGGAGAQSLWAGLALYLDAAEVFWQDWVMSYDLERQILLADRMGRSGRSFSVDWSRRLAEWGDAWRQIRAAWSLRLAVAVIGTVAWLALAIVFGPRLWRGWRTRRRVLKLQQGHGEASDATLLYERLLAVLGKRGFERPLWMTPAEFACVLPPSPESTLVGEFTSAYNDLRFGGKRNAAGRMVALLEVLESGPPSADMATRRRGGRQ